MSDSFVILTPNGDLGKAIWTRTGGASDNAALTDASDATYLTTTDAVGNFVNLDLTTHTFASTDIIKNIQVIARVSQGVEAPTLQASVNTAVQHYFDQSVQLVGSLYTVQMSQALTSTPSQSEINALNLQFSLAHTGFGSSAFVYEIQVTILYNQAPTTTVTGPSGSITSTGRPAITWTYSDPEGDAQERVKVRIFSAAQYGIAGFDPETSPNSYDSGEVLSSALTHTPTSTLTNGTTYKAYVKTADQGSSGRYGAWASGSTFTLALDLPATPTITAAVDNTNSRVTLTINGFDNMLTTNQASLETDTTGWAALANCAISRSTAQFKDGAASLALTSSASGNMTAQTPTGTIGITVAPSTAYQFIAYFRTAVSARSVNIGVKWYKSDGTASATPSNTGADVTDSSANFNTQAVLAVTSPSDAAYAAIVLTVKSTGAGSEVHYVDEISLAPGTSTTWTQGGYTGSQRVIIQRSLDQVTWTNLVRNNAVSPATVDSSGLVGLPTTTQVATCYDYETARGTEYSYRCYVYALSSSSFELDSAYSNTAQTMVQLLDSCKWNLKVPSNSSLNVLNVDIEQINGPELDITRHEQSGIFAAIGRPKQIKVTDVILGDEFDIKFLCKTAAVYAAVKTAVNSQTTLLLQSPYGDQWYVGLGPDVNFNISLLSQLYYRGIQAHCVEVDTP